jgi:hypothetical protein
MKPRDSGGVLILAARVSACVLASIGFLPLLGSAAAAGPEPTAVTSDQWLTDAETVLAKVDNYSALFHKRERIGNELLPDEVVRLLFKRPFKVRLQWTSGPLQGRDVIYAEGWNGNRVRVREKGILGIIPVNLDPRGGLAMKNNRHSILESGLGQLVERIASNLRRARSAGELTVHDRGTETLYGRKVSLVEGILPKDAAKGYYCHRAVLFVDTELKVPIRVQIYDGNDVLVEDYGFEGLKLEAGLTDKDLGIAER